MYYFLCRLFHCILLSFSVAVCEFCAILNRVVVGEEPTESSVSVALKFFSWIPSSSASVSRCGPFRINTRLPAGGQGCMLEPAVRSRNKPLGGSGRWPTWSRDDRFQVVLVQLQLVSGVDQLHHGGVFVLHLLQTEESHGNQKRLERTVSGSGRGGRYHDNGLPLVVLVSQLLGDDFDDDVGLQPVVGSDRCGLLLLFPLVHLQRTPSEPPAAAPSHHKINKIKPRKPSRPQ